MFLPKSLLIAISVMVLIANNLGPIGPLNEGRGGSSLLKAPSMQQNPQQIVEHVIRLENDILPAGFRCQAQIGADPNHSRFVGTDNIFAAQLLRLALENKSQIRLSLDHAKINEASLSSAEVFGLDAPIFSERNKGVPEGGAVTVIYIMVSPSSGDPSLQALVRKSSQGGLTTKPDFWVSTDDVFIGDLLESALISHGEIQLGFEKGTLYKAWLPADLRH